VLPDGRVRELQYIDFNDVVVWYETKNAGAAVTTGSSALHPGGILRLALTGRGMTGGIWDAGGADHKHLELENKILIKDEGVVDDHATHVAGTMVARGLEKPAMGMAPEAGLHSFDWNNDLSEMADEAASGLLVSNHSYGISLGWGRDDEDWEWHAHADSTEDYRFGFYNSKSRTLDEISFNAPYYSISWAAGNDRSDTGDGTKPPDGPYDCIGPEGTAKNIITVGAINKISNGYTKPSDVVMSPFSSWGPTDDGRIKPDITAAGVQLYSTYPGNSYGRSSGTSMATPNLSGTLLLLQQLYYEHNSFDHYMRSATLKGLVIHTASEAGNRGPDYRFGWGLLNAERAARVILFEDNERLFIREETLAEGQTFEMDFEVTVSENITATLSWTDPPGKPTSPKMNPTDLMLVNDLDMRIISDQGDEIYYPWRLNPDTPTIAATKGDNFRDNVEKITIDTLPAGRYILQITHKDTLANDQQDFSLLFQAGIIPERPTLYWIGDDGSWNDGTNWSLSSGGEAADRIPGANDHVVFDDNSFTDIDTTALVLINDDVECYTFNWFAGKDARLQASSARISVHNSVYVSNALNVISDSVSFIFTGDQPNNNVSVNGSALMNADFIFTGNGIWNITDTLHVNTLSVYRGVINAVNTRIITREMQFLEDAEPDNELYVNLNNSRIDSLRLMELSNRNLVFTAENSVINFENRPGENGESFLIADDTRFWNINNQSSSITVTGSNFFNGFKGSGAVNFSGSNYMDSLLLLPGSELHLEAGSRQVISSSFEIISKADSIVGLISGGAENATIEVQEYQKLCFDYLQVFGISATGGAVFNAGINSVIDDASTGWQENLCENVFFADYIHKYGCVDSRTYFYDRSSGDIEEWLWEFGTGDELLQSDQGDIHYSYVDTGVYDVSLTIFSRDDSKIYTKSIDIIENTLEPPGILISGNRYTSATLAMDYKWYRDGEPIDGATNRSYTNQDEVSGVYQVQIFDRTCNIFSEPLITNAEKIYQGNSNGLILYPNPVKDVLFVELDNLYTGPVIFDILDIAGQMVNSVNQYKPAGIYNFSLDVSALSQGLYLIRVKEGNDVMVKSFVKN
ncbi:MAG: S8 family serine peptidase, partial [bacterium]